MQGLAPDRGALAVPQAHAAPASHPLRPRRLSHAATPAGMPTHRWRHAAAAAAGGSSDAAQAAAALDEAMESLVAAASSTTAEAASGYAHTAAGAEVREGGRRS